MDFDQAFQVFMSWQTAVLCLGIYVITYVIRTVLEFSFPNVKNSKWWTELFLPLGPIGTGALLGAFAVKFPWPVIIDGAVQAELSARLMYGMICGLTSGWAYNRLRSWMKATEAGEKPALPFTPPTFPKVDSKVDAGSPDDKQAP